MKGPEAKIIGYMEGADKRSVSARRIMRCCFKIYMRVLHKYAYGIFCKKNAFDFSGNLWYNIDTEMEGEIT